jgi:hypothetical protein
MSDQETSVVSEGDVAQETAKERKQPAGTVERILNFRDRNLLIGACREFCQADGKGDHKAQAKLDRVTKLILLEETIRYFEMIDDSLEDELFRWQRLRNDWLAWQQYQGGGLSVEELKKKAPSVDPAVEPKRPPRKQPEAAPADLRGKERPFYFPSKLDVWAQECLKRATWNPLAAEYVTELCSKFGIKEEE